MGLTDVVDVLTVSRGVRSIHTGPDTEVVYPSARPQLKEIRGRMGHTRRHEARPLVSLLVVSESVCEDQTTFGVSKTSPRYH